MNVSKLELAADDDSCEVRAWVTGGKLLKPFLLWYRFPSQIRQHVEANVANALLVALLLPSMKARDTLEAPAPVSARLLGAMFKLQLIYHAWDCTLEKVAVNARPRAVNPLPGPENALFFSCGVDSLYSLIRNTTDHPLKENEVSLLVVVHGTDLNVGDWKSEVYRQMLAHTQAVGRHFHKKTLGVSTNIKDFMTATGVPWEAAQGPALASIGLFLEGVCRGVCFASNASLTDLSLTGTHPLIDPLWSTESIRFANDGWEESRLEKTRLISRHQIALDVLRVCWAKERPEFNCGKCSKCLTTMLGLHIVGSLKRCRTLPYSIDLDALRRIPILHPYEEPQFLDEIAEALRHSSGDEPIRAALLEGLGRSRKYFARLASAKQSIADLIPLPELFILVDQDTIREELVGRRIVPFLERNGQYYGKPPDDETAIREVERLRAEGAAFMVFWWANLWWLDHYVGLSRHLRTNYTAVLEDENLVIFDLRNRVEGTLKASAL